MGNDALTALTDEALFGLYVDGDRAAFRALFTRYSPQLTRIVQRRVRDAVLTDDLVQQTFLQLHRARRDFGLDRKLRPWLLTICLNLVRQHYRRTKRATNVPIEHDSHLLPATEAHDPLALERARHVRSALERLPAGQRQVIELHWLDGLSFPEIAEVLDLGLSAVKVRAHRGYARLRPMLQHIKE